MNYFKPILHDEHLELKCFDFAGDEVPFIEDPDQIVTLGYYTDNIFTELVEIKETNTPIKVEDLDRDFLYVEVRNQDINNPEDYYPVEVFEPYKTLSYVIHYQVERDSIRTSNLTLARYNYFMPKWSSAYKNNISTYSKTFYPVFEYLDTSLIKIQKDILRNVDLTSFLVKKEYKKDLLQVRLPEVGTLLSVSNIEKVRASDFIIDLENTLDVEPNLSYLSNKDLPYDVHPDAPYIYVVPKSDLTYVILKGLDHDNNYIEEYFTFENKLYKMSNYKFRVIIDMESDGDVEITEWLDGSTLNMIRSKVKFSFFVNNEKEFEIPKVTFEPISDLGGIIQLYSMLNTDDPVLTFNFELVEKIHKNLRVFIDRYGKVTIVNNSSIYSGVLEQPLQHSPLLHPSNNNNDFVFVTSDSAINGESFLFEVNTSLIRSTYGTSMVYLRLQDNDKVYYLDNDFNMVTKKEPFFIPETTKNIEIKIKYVKNKFYTLNVDIEDETFTASTYSSNIELSRTQLSSVPIAIIINNNKIYIDLSSGWHNIKTSNMYYEQDSSNQYFLSEYSDILEVQYSDFSRGNV